ncbi:MULTISPECIES: diguanylate cyclase [unclassified Exiguobacterium]|uniref:diguanylate cyclase domain-containing protein n=1 Tax=unclassified Exiguobacterium TaxID=2644629 RepID=UPI001BE87C18|nr:MULTISPECIES: diguanylate cyclase [unclassified Exiguobacterium]
MIKSFTMRLGLILALSIATLVFLLTIALTSLISHRASDSLEQEIGERLSTTSHQLADKLDFYMWSRYQEVQLLQGLDLEEPEETRRLLNQVQSNIPAFSWMGVTDADGTVVASTNGILEEASIAERPVYLEAQVAPFIGDVHEAVLLAELLPNPTGEPLQFVDISVPLFQDGTFQGVLATHLSWAWGKEVLGHFNRTLHEQVDDTDLFVVSERDNVILLGPDDMVGKPLPVSFTEGATVKKWEDGQDYLTGMSIGEGYDEYPGLGWRVVVRQPAAVAFAPVETLETSILWIGLFASLVTAVLGWLLASIVTRPLKRITETASLMEQGKANKFPHQSGIEEIESLAFALESLVTSLTESESERVHFEKLANRDALTGLSNRVALREQLNRLYDSEETHVFFYIDLDGFKAVNDTYGHAVGDALLVEISQRLRTLTIDELYPVRLSGDEFFLMFPRRECSVEEIHQIGKSVIDTLSQPVTIDTTFISVGASIGASIWSPPEPPHVAIEQADDALYRSKANGKQQLSFHELFE